MGCFSTLSGSVKTAARQANFTLSGSVKTAAQKVKSKFSRRKDSDTEKLLPKSSEKLSQISDAPPAVDRRNKLQKARVSKAIEPPTPAQANTLTINLENQTTSDTVYAFVTGRALDKNNALFLLQSDGKTGYYPDSPSATMQKLGQECAIKLGKPGSITPVQIPHLAGGRVWFSTDKPLSFFINPGPSLVEPSAANDSDPNNELNWGFAEMTWNNDQLYANISYVDFVGVPAALTLETVGSGTKHVSGMRPDGVRMIADGLRSQAKKDNQGWDQLIVPVPGANDKALRILSPGQGMNKNSKLFEGYYDAYVDQVFRRFSTIPMSIDTQMKSGIVKAQAVENVFDFQGSKFGRPTTGDIFSCDTGPFKTGDNIQTNAIIPRLAAEFNRSNLLSATDFPAPSDAAYKSGVTNHYSRLVHDANLDGKGYAFPYDDVQPTNGKDQSGEVHAGDPKALTVTIGGGNAHI